MKRTKVVILVSAIVIVGGVIFALYLNKSNPHQSAEYSTDSAKKPVTTASYSRALSDISTFMGIYDDVSYKKASKSLAYNSTVTSKYFSKESTFVSYSGQTNVEIKYIGLDKEGLDSSIRKFFAKVTIEGHDYSGNVCVERYSVDITYDNSIITDIVKRRW